MKKTLTLITLIFCALTTNAQEILTLDQCRQLALEHNKLSEGFSGSIVLEPTVEYKTLKGEKGGTGNHTGEKRDLLDNIIEKINIMYQGNFTEADRVIVETIYDAMKKEEKKLSKMLSPAIAGTTLAGKWLDLMMSVQYVDSDGDGKKDDVKLGIWFDGHSGLQRELRIATPVCALARNDTGNYISSILTVKGALIS